MLPSIAPAPSRQPNTKAALNRPTPRGSGYPGAPSLDDLLRGSTTHLPSLGNNFKLASAMLDEVPKFSPLHAIPNNRFPAPPPKITGSPRSPKLPAQPSKPKLGAAGSVMDELLNGPPKPRSQTMDELLSPQVGPEAQTRHDDVVTRMLTDPEANASRDRMKQSFAPVADRDLVLQGALPAVARRTDLTPDQQNAFTQVRAARQAEMDLRKQRQFARAQFREAAAGRGAIYDDDGGLDLLGSLGINRAFNAGPDVMQVDAKGRTVGFENNHSANALDALLGRHSVDGASRIAHDRNLLEAHQAQANRRFLVDEMLQQGEQFDAELALKRIIAGAEIDGRRRSHRLDRKRFQSDAELQQRKLELEAELEQLRLEEQMAQGEYDRSPEPHRRKIDEKRTMPSSLYESRYLPPMR